jgi:hypothetical protein
MVSQGRESPASSLLKPYGVTKKTTLWISTNRLA